jgi:16S rRNA (uracil1498-N3)-methyltransferase
MRHRIYTSGPFVPGADLAIEGEELHHAARVVRVREGEAVEVFDGRGNSAAGSVVVASTHELRIRVTGLLPSREARVAIDLAMAIIAIDKFELVLQKATELGVRSILPVITDRVEVRAERYRGKSERWEKILFEAVKQSGRSVVPTLAAPAPFADIVSREGVKILFDADAEESERPAKSDRATLFVGPEGGWSEAELHLARQSRCAFRRLGPRRMRAETAAIVALAVAAYENGEL